MIPPKARRGRPRKYDRPSRPVTLRLPEDTIARLSAVDADLGRAIVSVASRRLPAVRPAAPVERFVYGKHSVIVVSPVAALARLAGVQLVPIGAGRALIALDPSYAIPQLELDLRDAIAKGRLTRLELETFEILAGMLQGARRSRHLTLEQRTIIVIEPSH